MFNLLRKLPKVLDLLIDFYRRDALIWTEPKKARIVVLDASSVREIVPLFGGEPFEIIYTRGEKLYLTPAIVWSTVINYIKKTASVSSAYVLAILKTIRPVLVVTFIDNSGIFQDTARLYKDARFLAVQNSSRNLLAENPGGNRPIYLTEFACFGKNEIEMYTKYGAHVGQFYPVGSLTDCYYREYRSTLTTKATAQTYDLCLVSEFTQNVIDTAPLVVSSIQKLAKNLARFCEKNKRTLCVAGRIDPTENQKESVAEVEWYKNHMGESVNMIPRRSKEFTTYQLIDSCSLSLALCSTTLAEGFARGNRFLYCNYTGDDAYDFPVRGPWFLKDPSYELFEKRILELLAMSDQQFMECYGDVAKYLVNYDENIPTHIFLRNLISEALNKPV